MSDFVHVNSIVRQIWGKSDTILFIFAGAAAEFSLNKAVDWLYFTGKLPTDPLGRLFSTVQYARMIVFSTETEANKAIDNMRSIHTAVEQSRGGAIPDWAYRDVLFMLIYYSIAAFELLERSLSPGEKEEVHNVFFRVGQRMGLTDLPKTYKSWLPVRERHLRQDLTYSRYTPDLYRQYSKHLGWFRFKLLVEAQKLLIPDFVSELLGFRSFSLLGPAVPVYKLSRKLKLDGLVKKLLLPSKYKRQILALDNFSTRT